MRFEAAFARSAYQREAQMLEFDGCTVYVVSPNRGQRAHYASMARRAGAALVHEGGGWEELAASDVVVVTESARYVDAGEIAVAEALGLPVYQFDETGVVVRYRRL